MYPRCGCMLYMDFDWSVYSSADIKPPVAAESFEDPFSLRFLPDGGPMELQSRFFCLGRTLEGKGLFSVYSSNGKLIRVITSRLMTEEEEFYYDRRLKEDL